MNRSSVPPTAERRRTDDHIIWLPFSPIALTIDRQDLLLNRRFIFREHFLERSIAHQRATPQPDRPRAERPNNSHVVRHHQQGLARASEGLDAVEALLLEVTVADRKAFV